VTPEITVIVPVRNGGAVLGRCLEAINRSRGVDWDCIVVDDGSTDDSADIARRHGAQVLASLRPHAGPGQARNRGAQVARAPLLCFVDADVLIRPDTLAQFALLFARDPDLTAAFGSYDSAPDHPDMLSQYRNLVHHFVHQTGHTDASTFWSGCGAIRRDDFLRFGGFDPAYTRPSIEDIELGYRLRFAGARILLAKHIQVTHLKRWTMWGVLMTDIRDRALPWTSLIARTRHLPNDLNLDTSSRLSAVGVYALAVALLVGLGYHLAWVVALGLVLLLLVCNRALYSFFLTHRGPWFLIRALPLHWLYFAYSALAFGAGMLFESVRQRTRQLPSAEPLRLSPLPRLSSAPTEARSAEPAA
jgi:glycosyltransferase involved in cell wall biosynthesis